VTGNAGSGYLLDTCTALLALADPGALSRNVRKAILGGENFLSVVSYWEVVLKSMKGALDVGDPRTWWSEALEQLAASPLLLRPQHIARVCSLPAIHRDPFDRVLAAQAAQENLTLVTCDEQLARYASKELRIVR
jgi:PIN domain nuclease of toxin-antitoxin system